MAEVLTVTMTEGDTVAEDVGDVVQGRDLIAVVE